MAGIISNVDSDVQKLRKLKNAIEDVKKSLKGINIKVDIDIANGLQAQLKSLTEQYHALVSKIADAEGKILLSTKRINDASEKIIQAQETVSKVVSTPAQTGNVNTQANTAETVSIQAQAKAYDDLKTEINDILGTRDANVKRMVDEMNAIRLINMEIKKITKSQGESSSLSSAQQKRLEHLNNSLLTHKTALSEVRQTLSNNVKLDNVASTSMNGLSQSLSRMRIAYRELTEEERNSPLGKELLASINQADAKIKELDATIGNHQRNVGNYGKQWNGLSMSIQQVGRELPSLAYGPKVFFSAISNNLPILADEIKRARTEYELLKKSGQSATPVWKQVVSSLFSWQTALTVGITLLTLYGDKIVDWVGSLFTVKKALSETYQSLEDYQKKVGETSGTVISTLERLSQGWKRLGGDIDAQKKFILENKDAIDSMGVSVNDAAEAEKLFNINKDTFIMGLLQRAKAASTMELAAEEYKKAVQKMMEADAMPDKVTHRYSTATNVIDFFKKSTWQTVEYNNPDKLKAQEQADNFIKSGTELVMKYAQFSEEERKTLESIGIKTTQTMINGSIEAIEAAISLKQQALKKVTDHKEYKRIEAEIKAEQSKLKAITGEKDKITTSENLRKQTDKYKLLLDKQALEQKRSVEDLQMKVDEARIKAMDEGSAKTIAEMELNFEKEMQAIDRQKEDALRKKIDDSRAAWEANPKNKGKSFDATEIELSDDEQKYFDELYKATIANNEKTYSDLADKYQSYTDERLAIEKKFNDDIAVLQEARKKAEAKGDTDEVAKIDRSIEKRTETKNEDVFKLDAEQFKKSMDWEQVFGNLDKVSTDTLKKLKANLKGFISAQKNLSPENLKELVDAIERIDDKVSERNPFESMSASFKSLKEATDAQHEAQEAYNKALKEGTDEEKKNAKAALESAKNSKQKALYEATDALHKGINEIGQYVDAGNEVIGIMETLGVKTPEWLEGTMSGFGEMLDGLGSIDLMKPMSIVTGGLQTIKGALTSITSLGGVINWSGSNAKEVQKTIDRLTERNEILGKSIDRLTDIMEKSAGSKAISAYEEARKNQQEKNENLLGIAQSQAGYHNSHKSWQYYMRWTDEQLKWAQENVDVGFTGTYSLWELTPEQMNKLLSNVNIYEQIKNAGKGGYGSRVMEDLEEYAEQAGKIADLEASINESLMNVSFDGLRSSFLDSLMDMEKDAKGFSDDFSEMMQRALLDFSLGETFDNELKDWYNDVAKAISDNKGKLSETQMDDFKKRYDDIVNAAMYERDKIAELTGYTGGKDDTRTASQKGIATASQDSVDENNGRLAVMQGHTYSINENVTRMATGIDTIANHTANLSCLTNIDKTMQSILSMRDAALTHLSNIDGHTSRLEAIEDAIVFMKNDINTMLIKGLKLSKN